MIIRRPSPPPPSPETWPYRRPDPADAAAWPANDQPTAAPPAGPSSAASPWPELPDDDVLWQAPRPERSAERIRRLDAEQRGA
jgi:hypothetical protein